MGSNGFTLGTDSAYNDSGSTYVAWCWKAGGAPDLTSSPTKPFAKDGVQYETLSAANITAGTITPTAMSVNTDAGFSIVKWQAPNNTSLSNPSIPHGLNKTPDFIIIKSLESLINWFIWHTSFSNPAANYNVLNDSSSTVTAGINIWGNSGPSNNLINFAPNSSAAGTNYSDDNMIAYCWHSVEGYSKFGSYIGNGSTDGPFVYCGFRPAWIMIKRTDTAAGWLILDSERDPFNVMDGQLYANGPDVESGGATADFVSNGFKIRETGGGTNGTGSPYIFMAFAEQPFKFSNAR